MLDTVETIETGDIFARCHNSGIDSWCITVLEFCSEDVITFILMPRRGLAKRPKPVGEVRTKVSSLNL
jgi:hypothetical protein